MLVFAIDPGERHCGFAALRLSSTPRRPHRHDLAGTADCFDQTPDRRLCLRRCLTFAPYDLADYLEANLRLADVLVIERFQLYPWMARQQGFSEFGTAESIGIYKRIAHKLGIRYVLQDAAGCKKDGRTYAKTWGMQMTDRKLGSGKWTYWGPDFSLPGQPHRRDAAAHAFYYIGSRGLYALAA